MFWLEDIHGFVDSRVICMQAQGGPVSWVAQCHLCCRPVVNLKKNNGETLRSELDSKFQKNVRIVRGRKIHNFVHRYSEVFA